MKYLRNRNKFRREQENDTIQMVLSSAENPEIKFFLAYESSGVEIYISIGNSGIYEAVEADLCREEVCRKKSLIKSGNEKVKEKRTTISHSDVFLTVKIYRSFYVALPWIFFSLIMNNKYLWQVFTVTYFEKGGFFRRLYLYGNNYRSLLIYSQMVLFL